MAREGRCVDATVDLIGGLEAQREGLAVTRERGSFVTVVGPEQYVGERRLNPLQLTGMLGRIGWKLVGSRFVGPRYHFAGPLAPDFDAIMRSIVEADIRPVIDRVVEFAQEPVRAAIAYVASHRARGKVVIKI